MRIRKKTKSKLTLSAAIILTAGCVLYSVFPLAWMIVSSLKPYNELFSSPPTFLPKTISFVHYQSLLSLTNFSTYFANSLVVALAVTAFSVTVGTLGAYSIARFSYRGKTLLSHAILLTYMFPSLLMGIPIFLLFSAIKLTDSLLGLVIGQASYSIPFTIWLLWAFFRGVPADLEDAAMTDGATRLQAIRKVVLPTALPGVITAAIMSFIWSWNDFTIALILIRSDEFKTLPLGTSMMFQIGGGVEWGMLMASSVAMTLPVLIGFIFVEKYLERGFGLAPVRGM